MSSTRNKNTPGNYQLEQTALNNHYGWCAYEHAPQARAFITHMPGDGLIHGRVGASELSHNATDIESFLHGIGSSNLVAPYQPPSPQIKTVQSLNIADKLPLILPKNLIVEQHQRPSMWNK
jgi:hypothetical protein